MLLTTERNSNDYPRSIDETPKFVDNPNSGTAPIEHYIRRLVTYLARLQSVTQNSEKGLKSQGIREAGYEAMAANVFSDLSCLRDCYMHALARSNHAYRCGNDPEQ